MTTRRESTAAAESVAPALAHAFELAGSRRRLRVGTACYPYKRAVDILLASVALILSAPLLVVLAVLVATTSRGPVLYRSKRLGRHGRTFKCLKFRTMVQDAEERLRRLLESDPTLKAEYERTLKLKNDPRITRIGRFLRLTSLDELPQFWNVLVGDMSVVGPRPLLIREADKYGDALGNVLSVRPGLTGPWQVSGRNNLSYEARVALAEDYALSHSFSIDLSIILRTPSVMLQKEDAGAY